MYIPIYSIYIFSFLFSFLLFYFLVLLWYLFVLLFFSFFCFVSVTVVIVRNFYHMRNIYYYMQGKQCPSLFFCFCFFFYCSFWFVLMFVVFFFLYHLHTISFRHTRTHAHINTLNNSYIQCLSKTNRILNREMHVLYTRIHTLFDIF